MGEIVGAGLVSHVPTIMLPEEVRLEINDGKGHFTSHELPRGMAGIPYDMPGDPELAKALAAQAEGRDDTWILASDDPYLPIFYGTVNIWTYLNGGERWISIAINQTGQTDDFLILGELLGRAVAQVDRRVVVLASGGLSHRFFPFKELRHRESSDPSNVITPEAREADGHVLELMEKGDHRGVIDFLPDYKKHAPEGKFGHYLIAIGALGGAACTAPGEPFSDYEASVGTGQVHVWFQRPEAGWTA
jgi:aromatic ring-opening dioxygenase catalytic subunit (LigB family)